MELNLQSFSLTLAIAVGLAFIVRATLQIIHPEVGNRFLPLLELKEGSSQHWISAVGASVILLAVGIICEDVSKNALENSRPYALGPQLTSILGTEMQLRCNRIVKGKLCDPNKMSDADVCSSDASVTMRNCSEYLQPVRVEVTDLGQRVFAVLQRVRASGVASPEEASVYEKLVSAYSLTDGTSVRVIDSKDNRKAFAEDMQRIYYIAKNTIYREDNYFSEAESIRMRYNFERSAVFVLLLGIFLTCLIYLSKATRTMWLDVGGWKSGISFIMVLLIVLAFMDIVTTSIDWPQELSCGSDIACKRRFNHGRSWMLPATLFFVCAYRIRRVGKRLQCWLLEGESIVQGPALLQTARELEAWKVLKLVAIVILVLAPISWSYRADYNNYVSRVFGYYESLRGGVLTCASSETCMDARKREKSQ